MGGARKRVYFFSHFLDFWRGTLGHFDGVLRGPNLFLPIRVCGVASKFGLGFKKQKKGILGKIHPKKRFSLFSFLQIKVFIFGAKKKSFFNGDGKGGKKFPPLYRSFPIKGGFIWKGKKRFLLYYGLKLKGGLFLGNKKTNLGFYSFMEGSWGCFKKGAARGHFFNLAFYGGRIFLGNFSKTLTPNRAFSVKFFFFYTTYVLFFGKGGHKKTFFVFKVKKKKETKKKSLLFIFGLLGGLFFWRKATFKDFKQNVSQIFW